MVQRYLNGELHFRYGTEELSYTLLPERPQPKRRPKKSKPTTGRNIMAEQLLPSNRAWRGFQFGKGPFWARSLLLVTVEAGSSSLGLAASLHYYLQRAFLNS